VVGGGVMPLYPHERGVPPLPYRSYRGGSIKEISSKSEKQFEAFFKEIGVNIDELGFGDEGFSMSGIVYYGEKLKETDNIHT
jgi:hypothetical protein